MNSLRNEIAYLFSGAGMPYEKICLAVAAFITIFFTITLGNNMARDVPVMVIDLDHSRYSQEVVEKIDSTPYMKVSGVIYTAEDPQHFLVQDKNYAVIVLPKDLEKNHYSGVSAKIGLFCDNGNTALDADIRASMNEIVGTENANTGVATGQSGGSLKVSERLLFNPAGSESNGAVSGFLIMFSSIFFTFATIGMVPRLRETPEWEEILETGNPLTLAVRLLPYLGCLLVALFMGLAILRVWSDLAFAGSVLDFLITQILFLPAMGLLSLIFGWGAANPGVASSRMIIFVPAGFIFSGATFPISLYPSWMLVFSHIFPLTWEFNFIRDVVIRGASLTQMPDIIGAFLLYLAVIFGVFCWRFMKERESLRKERLESREREAEWEAS